MRVVPLHSVVFICSPSVADRDRLLDAFEEHEWLSPPAIRMELVGFRRPHGLEEAVAQEVMRRMQSKLRMGERVVIDCSDIDEGQMPKSQRVALASAARSQGVPVIYIVAGNVDRDTQRGDGIAEVMDARTPFKPFTEPAPTDYAGVTVIGDVHGMYQSLLSALTWARQRNHFIVLLGDVIDYGPQTLEVADEVYRLVTRGEAVCVLGNHERKIMRWLDGQRVRLSEGNRTTTNALSHLGDSGRTKWAGRFRGLYQNSHLIYQIKNVIFVHGALHPDFWTGGETSKVVENHAFFGEVDETRSQPERPVRSYRWVDCIPSERTVVVGHDRRGERALIQPNTSGGTAIFLDTGSGKGGALSTADFRFEGGKLRLQNTSMH